jgi:molybdate transport system ATP-binding protein
LPVESLMPRESPLISFRDATFDVDGRPAFVGTTWQIRRGEQWAIVGPNGAGKSLLIAALEGRRRPSRGHVRHHFLERAARDGGSHGGRRPHSPAVVSTAQVRELADRWSPFHQARWHGSFGSESPTVDEALSADAIHRRNPFEVVERPLDVEAFRARRAEIVGLVGIERLLSRRLVHLSSGELRLFLLARAALRGPELLLVDEPFVGLDVATRGRMPGILDALIAGGLQLVIATSRPDELPALVTHVLHVRDFSVVYAGARSDAPSLDGEASIEPPSRPRPGAALEPRPEFGRRLPLVEIRRARIAYGSSVVLDEVDFSLWSDESWAILGPNGAGKTALCSLILADNPQSYANDIVLFGRRRGTGESIWDIKSRIGWVAPEIVAHYPRNVRSRDVVSSGYARSLGMWREPTASQDRAAVDWLERLGLGHAADRALGDLSHGEQRLVLVARALVADPWLLVLDEPCQGLDARHRKAVISAVDEAARGGRSRVVYVTHHAEEMPACITHVLEMNEGRVVRAGHH